MAVLLLTQAMGWICCMTASAAVLYVWFPAAVIAG
jgi:hypothetical protein